MNFLSSSSFFFISQHLSLVDLCALLLPVLHRSFCAFSPLLLLLSQHLPLFGLLFFIMSLSQAVRDALADFPFVPAENFSGQIEGERPCYYCVLSVGRDVRCVCVAEDNAARCVVCEDSHQKCCAVSSACSAVPRRSVANPFVRSLRSCLVPLSSSSTPTTLTLISTPRTILRLFSAGASLSVIRMLSPPLHLPII